MLPIAGGETRDVLTIEVTPETAEDAYGGWWLSVYDLKKLDATRATPKEVEAISEPVLATAEKATERETTTLFGRDDDDEVLTRWTPTDLKKARPVTYRAPAPSTTVRIPSAGSGGPSSPAASSSGGGRVYVRGYTRKDGTYVRAHTRSSPGRRR